MCVYIYIYIHIYMCMYVYIYIYIYNHKQTRQQAVNGRGPTPPLATPPRDVHDLLLRGRVCLQP